MKPLLTKLSRFLMRILHQLTSDTYVLLPKVSPSKNLAQVRSLGNNVHCEPGFTIYHGHQHITIGSNVYLADVLLNAGDDQGSITIDNDAFFGHHIQVIARGHDYRRLGLKRQLSVVEKPIHIQTGVWIGSGALILPGVTIGRHSVVGAGSVVTKDVPPYTLVAGNPAKSIKSIKTS